MCDTMKKASVLLIVLIIGLAGISVLSHYVQPVKAVYNVVEIDINADGSITPTDAPITNVDNSTYTLTDDVNCTGWAHPYNWAAIRINRDNAIFNGNGHIITNSGGVDCFVVGGSNVTIENSTAIGFNINVYIGTYNNTIRWNNFSGSGNNDIIRLQAAGNNTFVGNKITNGGWGVDMAYAGPNNVFIGNYIANNSGAAIGWNLGGGGATFYHNVIGGGIIGPYTPACIWDNGYPSGGNYWIGYISPDKFNGPGQNITGSDGIGDAPLIVDADDIDHYPMLLLNVVNASQTPSDNVMPTDAVSVNATVTHHFPLEQVILNCTYTNSSTTWTDSVNMTNLEDDVWNGVIPSLPFGTNVTYTIIARDNAGTSINSKDQGYTFEYPVVPEFPTIALLPILFAATLSIALVRGKKSTTKSH
jgi:predicted secreted protein with PEFG-CTERM motif